MRIQGRGFSLAVMARSSQKYCYNFQRNPLLTRRAERR
jgi:hypothetical protein